MRNWISNHVPELFLVGFFTAFFSLIAWGAWADNRDMRRRCEAMLHSATATDSVRILVVQPKCAP